MSHGGGAATRAASPSAPRSIVDPTKFRQLDGARHARSPAPGGTEEEAAAFNELERLSTTPENAARILDTVARLDVTNLLSSVTVPTLVTHCSDDGVIFHKAGRKMASMIPNARFETLTSRNHVILEHEPAFPRFLATIKTFLKETPGSA